MTRATKEIYNVMFIKVFSLWHKYCLKTYVEQSRALCGVSGGFPSFHTVVFLAAPAMARLF
jgi:hypothetical protein